MNSLEQHPNFTHPEQPDEKTELRLETHDAIRKAAAEGHNAEAVELAEESLEIHPAETEQENLEREHRKNINSLLAGGSKAEQILIQKADEHSVRADIEKGLANIVNDAILGK